MKSQTTGTEIKAILNGQILTVGNDGYVGEISGLCRVQIEARVEESRAKNVFGIFVDGKKNVALKKNILEDAGNGAVYRNFVEVKNNGAVFHTEYPNNHLRLLVVGQSGNIQIWEVALVSQNGTFFITQQKVWDTFCYNNNGKLTCPLFEWPKGWPQMIKLLESLITDVKALPPISKKKKEDVNLHKKSVLSNNKGIVVWYNLAQGFGVIKTPDGPARVHWTNISRKESQLLYLKPNELVSFEKLVAPRLTKGRQTAMKFDATGIRPLGQ